MGFAFRVCHSQTAECRDEGAALGSGASGCRHLQSFSCLPNLRLSEHPRVQLSFSSIDDESVSSNLLKFELKSEIRRLVDESFRLSELWRRSDLLTRKTLLPQYSPVSICSL